MNDRRVPAVPASQMSLFGVEESEDPSQPVREAPFAEPTVPAPRAGIVPGPLDDDARQFAVDPRNNVVLEASAGTGKTSVLVARYVNLLDAGVDPANILAITFTRKAAAEMRERIVRQLRETAGRSEFDKARWIELRDRLSDIAVGTIDAFCLSLLREFPLEADLDPGFDLADETDVPRLVEDALDRTMRILAGLAKHEHDVALVLAQLGTSRTRDGLASLLDRRLVAWDALNRFLARGPSGLTSDMVCRATATRLQDALRAVPGGLAQFLADGPVEHPRYQLLLRELQRLADLDRASDSELRTFVDRVGAHFLTNEGKARRSATIYPYKAEHYPSGDAAKRHRTAALQIAPHIENVVFAFARDLNVVLARGIRRMFAIALAQYRQALEERSLLDFSDVLQRALDLLRQMDEFSQSRFRLEARYHHVLVDEFQDTSRAQWELVSLLIKSWGEGLGLATEPSIFIVGDRKQSIYRFRDAEVTLLHEAARHIETLRPAGNPRRAISRSFRAQPELLEFVNDLFSEISQAAARPGDFTYADSDRFPVDASRASVLAPVLGVAVADDPEVAAAAVAAEIARVLQAETVRDRKTGVPRQARPGDIAILFRSRATHREFQSELEARRIPAYVYKGLGFFDADEIKDLAALMRYLANPGSDLRASAFLRSRFVRLSDRALAVLGGALAASLTDAEPPAAFAMLDSEDRQVLTHIRVHVGDWLGRVDRIPPADLIEALLSETAYAFELGGPRRQQAWENVKKMRGLVRRIQNRGYATLARIADHIDSLTAGDESNAVLEALDAVNLMTIHASKGLEFPIVFVVNLAKGATGPARPVRVVPDGEGGEPSVSVGPFLSATDDIEREREKHETRRLLYVAVTRARDRLYLSTTLKDGVLQPGRGSLAEVFPDSLKQILARAASAFDACETIGWSGVSGRPYEWRICRPPAAIEAALPAAASAERSAAADDFGAIVDDGAGARLPVTGWLAGSGTPDATSAAGTRDRIIGTLVHRLFQSSELARRASAPEDEARFAQALLQPDDRAALENVNDTVASALNAWRAMRHQGEVLLASGRRSYEVPFSLIVPGDRGSPSAVLRGSIDCLVQRADGSVVVIDFKTGRRRPAHQQQLDVYVRAARALFPGASVEGQLIYPDAEGQDE